MAQWASKQKTPSFMAQNSSEQKLLNQRKTYFTNKIFDSNFVSLNQ
jgi:hypothetical protein